MTTGRAVKTQWIHRDDEVKPEPIDIRMKKARRLPLPGPGIVITVPLALLPEYLDLHSLVPMASGEVRDVAAAAKRNRLPGVLYVRRTASPAPVKRIKRDGK